MRLGIDFGTTRTRVAAAIRGNYPLITFQAGRDHALDWYPSLIATQGERAVFGLRAQAVQYDPEWSLLGSFKRLLADSQPDAAWNIGAAALPMIEWLTRFLVALRLDLVHRSSLEISPRDRLEVMLGTPAHANSNQRFGLLVDAEAVIPLHLNDDRVRLYILRLGYGSRFGNSDRLIMCLQRRHNHEDNQQD